MYEVMNRRSESPRFRRVTVRLAAMAAALVLMGCALGGGIDRSAWYVGGNEEESILLRVDNRNWSEMRIYLVIHGDRRRLGSVSSQSREVFALDETAAVRGQSLNFEAVPLGDRNNPHRSPTISLTDGNAAEWRLENQLSQSTLRVR